MRKIFLKGLKKTYLKYYDKGHGKGYQNSTLKLCFNKERQLGSKDKKGTGALKSLNSVPRPGWSENLEIFVMEFSVKAKGLNEM